MTGKKLYFSLLLMITVLVSTLPLSAQDGNTSPLADPNATSPAGVPPSSPEPNAPLPRDPNVVTMSVTTDEPMIPTEAQPPEPNRADPNLTEALPDFGPLDPNDPNSPIVPHDPNDAFFDVDDSLSAPASPTPLVRRAPAEYWRFAYHPQVTERIFIVLEYPYYPGGVEYPKPFAFAEETSADHDPSIAPSPTTATDPNDLAKAQHLIESCSARVHQWRMANESPAAVLEVLRTIELTKHDTGIYIAAPGLAVDAKRTLGRLARNNRRFDVTARMAVRAALQVDTNPVLIYRMDKQLADMGSLLERLAEQNDQLSIALGLGKIDRSSRPPIFNERIDYSHLGMIPTQ